MLLLIVIYKRNKSLYAVLWYLAVMMSFFPLVTTTACATQVYLSQSVELMVSPTSHLAEQAVRSTIILMATLM